MSHIHYLRELTLIRKRITQFTDELQHRQDANLPKYNSNTDRDLLLKILNELRSLKMSSIIRYKQQFYQLYSRQDDLAKKFLLRAFKERYFLKQINNEIEKFGGHSEFRPVIHATVTREENYPSSQSEKILRENAAAHSIMVDCYRQLIICLRNLEVNNSSLAWLLKAMMVMQQKYNRSDHVYLEKIAA